MKEKIIKLFKIVFSKEFILQVIKFGIAGGTTAIIDWCTLAICNKVFHIDSMLANVICFFVSVPYNYWANQKFVFDFDKSQGKKLVAEFVALAFVGFLINEITMYVGDKMLHIDPLIVKVAGIAFAAVFNFLSRKLLLEKRQSKETTNQ